MYPLADLGICIGCLVVYLKPDPPGPKLWRFLKPRAMASASGPPRCIGERPSLFFKRVAVAAVLHPGRWC